MLGFEMNIIDPHDGNAIRGIRQSPVAAMVEVWVIIAYTMSKDLVEGCSNFAGQCRR